MRDVKLSIYRNPVRRTIDFYLVEKSIDGHIAVGKPVEMVNLVDDGASYFDPTFILCEENAQLFIDELWNQGFRPSKHDNDGGAQEKHLQDMRKIAFQFLDKLNNE